MYIEVVEAVPHLMAGDLSGGDVFVRDAVKDRPMSSRARYLVLWGHTRLADLKKYKSTSKAVVIVDLRTGRLDSVDKEQPVLRLVGKVNMALEES